MNNYINDVLNSSSNREDTKKYLTSISIENVLEFYQGPQTVLNITLNILDEHVVKIFFDFIGAIFGSGFETIKPHNAFEGDIKKIILRYYECFRSNE